MTIPTKGVVANRPRSLVGKWQGWLVASDGASDRELACPRRVNHWRDASATRDDWSGRFWVQANGTGVYLITGIHGDAPVRVYGELCKVMEEVITHFESEKRPLPAPGVRPMREGV